MVARADRRLHHSARRRRKIRRVNPDIVIVGAGIIGSSIAYHLARRGAKNVLVLERDAASDPDRSAPDLTVRASCARATGGFRVQYGTAINVRLSMMARTELLEFEALTGVNAGYEPCGYLFLAQNANQLEGLQQALTVQRSAGLEVSRIVTPQEIHALNPALSLEGIAGGSYCPWDGFVRPLDMRRGYQQAAEELGVRFRFGCDVTLERSTDGVQVVHDGSRLDCGAVINAAGAWAAELMNSAKLELPVQPVKRQIAATIPTQVLPSDMPMSIFAGDGFHLRVRDGRVLLLMPFEFAAQDLTYDLAWLPDLLDRTHARVPSLRDVPIETGWAGLYEVSPDGHALLGAHWDAPNLYLANGSSGHGVMHSPALGKLLSEIVLGGRASSLDVSSLRPERFLEGQPMIGNSLL